MVGRSEPKILLEILQSNSVQVKLSTVYGELKDTQNSLGAVKRYNDILNRLFPVDGIKRIHSQLWAKTARM